MAVTGDPQRGTRAESKEGLDIESLGPLAEASAEFVKSSENFKVLLLRFRAIEADYRARIETKLYCSIKEKTRCRG